MKSEFPETKLSKFGKRFGWIFSPLLFILLLGYTLFTAQNLTIDPFSGDISRFGNIHLKEISDSEVFFDGRLAGRTTSVLRTNKVESNQSLQVTVRENGRKDWNKTVRPREGYVSILFPIMYPQELAFNDGEFTANTFYKSPNPNIIFYEKIEGNSINLYRYEVQRLLFTLNIRNDRIVDLTSLIKRPELNLRIITPQTSLNILKERKIYPGNTGSRAALVIPGERVYLIEDNGTIRTVPNYIPQNSDTLFWSPNDESLVISSKKEILSVNVDSNTVNVVNRASNNEELDVQFTLINGIIYKVTSPNTIELRENNYLGNNPITIEIPNIDGLRRNNMQKAYDMTEKQNSILLQTSNNIYMFNVSTFELRKFNTFDGEKIVHVDPIWEVVITKNTNAKNQFRYYNLEENDSRTFTLDDINTSTEPQNITALNYSQNLALDYNNRVVFIDSDGANRVDFSSNASPQTVIAIKADRNVFFAIAENNSSEDRQQNGLKIRVERFEN